MLANLLLAALTGILLVLIHPRFELVLLAPFALTPLLLALAREWRPKYRFLLGYVAGAVFWGGMCWIRYVIAVHGGIGYAGGTAIFVLFCFTPAVNMAFFGLLAGIVIQRAHAIPILACMWVAVERIPTPFNFMWLKLGDAGVNMGVPIRVAPYTGVYGLSFFFALMSAALAWVMLKRPRRDLLWLIIVVVPFAFTYFPDQVKSTDSAVTVRRISRKRRIGPEWMSMHCTSGFRTFRCRRTCPRRARSAWSYGRKRPPRCITTMIRSSAIMSHGSREPCKRPLWSAQSPIA